MVTQFPLDPMRMLDLGFGKRILTCMFDICNPKKTRNYLRTICFFGTTRAYDICTKT